MGRTVHYILPQNIVLQAKLFQNFAVNYELSIKQRHEGDPIDIVKDEPPSEAEGLVSFNSKIILFCDYF